MTFPRKFSSFDSDTCQHTEPGVEGEEEEVLVVRRERSLFYSNQSAGNYLGRRNMILQ